SSPAARPHVGKGRAAGALDARGPWRGDVRVDVRDRAPRQGDAGARRGGDAAGIARRDDRRGLASHDDSASLGHVDGETTTVMAGDHAAGGEVWHRRSRSFAFDRSYERRLVYGVFRRWRGAFGASPALVLEGALGGGVRPHARARRSSFRASTRRV